MISASRRFGLLLTTLAGLGVVACGSDAPAPEAPAAAPNPVPAPVSSSQVQDELPESLPGDLPLLGGLSPTAVHHQEGAGMALGFEAPADAAQVAADYVALLESEGWTTEKHDTPAGIMIVANRGTANAVVRVVQGESGAAVQVVATP